MPAVIKVPGNVPVLVPLAKFTPVAGKLVIKLTLPEFAVPAEVSNEPTEIVVPPCPPATTLISPLAAALP